MKFNMNTPFQPAEPLTNSGYRIRFSADVYNKIGYTEASYNIVLARLLGISYAKMLSFLQSKGAIVSGRNTKYCNYYFPADKYAEVESICIELNKRWESLWN